MSDGDGAGVFSPGGVTYLRIPAPEPRITADFYAAAFGWEVHGSPDSPGFSDATGRVIGHFLASHEVAGEAGVRPYVYVDSVDSALSVIRAAGGEVVTEPYPEGDLWVATFRDPAGNVLGVWQR